MQTLEDFSVIVQRTFEEIEKYNLATTPEEKAEIEKNFDKIEEELNILKTRLPEDPLTFMARTDIVEPEDENV